MIWASLRSMLALIENAQKIESAERVFRHLAEIDRLSFNHAIEKNPLISKAGVNLTSHWKTGNNAMASESAEFILTS